jgi:uncharacterized membrane protein
MKNKRNTTFFFGTIMCLLIRLIPMRPPNVEPILVSQMPFAKQYGAVYGFLFGVLSVVLYDVITGTVGVWTLVTATTYGVVGLGAAAFFKNREANRRNFVSYAVISTLFYDAVTGLSIGPLFFHQSFTVALSGQVLFTALHLCGNIIFAFLVSPAIYGLLTERHRRTSPQPALSLSPQQSFTL